MTTNTITSPTGAGALPAGTTPIGGVVVDLIGLNGVRVVAQLAASDMFVGFFNSGTPSSYNGNPGTAGVLEGLTPATIAALGGGISKMAVRVTLYDGDSASGDFDDGDNTFLVNDVAIGNFSDVLTDATDSTGATLFGSEDGFRNESLNTGWFLVTDAATLASIYTTLSSTGDLSFKVSDVDAFDNFYDFTQGLDGSLVDVGSPPNTAPVTAADSYSAGHNTAITVNAANGVLKNDMDVEGTALTASVATTTANGTLVFNADGSFTYTPNAGFSGTDSFVYNASDGALSTAQLVTINVASPSTGGGTPGSEILGTKWNDNLTGTTGNDSIRAKAGDDVINAGTGNDFVTGDEGNDVVTAGKGDDRVDGGAGNDTLYGREGNDLLMGGTGDDRINGDAGNDIIYGQSGTDVLSGGDGWDVFFFGIADGNDTIVDFAAGDKLNLSATGLSFADLLIVTDALGTHVEFGTTAILLKNVGSVSASDFIF